MADGRQDDLSGFRHHAYGVITQPLMRPLAPLATELAIMTIGFCYIMIVYCLYSATWARVVERISARRLRSSPVPIEPLRPLACSITLLQVIITECHALEAALFALLRCCSCSLEAPFTAFGECRVRSWAFARRPSRHAHERDFRRAFSM